MTTLFINDKEVTVPAGTSLLEACLQNDTQVPYFCYHPELSVAANCRMCLVNVEGFPKPAASCCTPAQEGMKVYTHTPEIEKDRAMMMEYLLINHPLDCPVCDQGGSCKLQDYAMEHGESYGRYHEPKRAPVDYELGPFINTCMTRCIHCTRCVRFADEVAGTGDMGVLNRGDHMSIDSVVEDCLSSELSGNLADICPVGALLDKPYHDTGRPWEMQKHKSTCTLCPHGCDIRIDSKGQDVKRIQPVPGSPEPWICDRGRYVYDAFRSDQRLHAPVRVENGKRETLDWDAAMVHFRSLVEGKKVGIVFSSHWSVEGLASIKLMRDIVFPDAHVSFDLHRRDMRPFAFDEGFSMTTQDIEDCDHVVILGSDLRQRLPLLMTRIRRRVNDGKAVSRIGAMNYRTNTTLTHDELVRPSDWAAVIARAMDQMIDLGKQAAGMENWCAAIKERHEAGKVLADALATGTCSILVGDEIRAHPDAAALIHGLDLLMRGAGQAEEDHDGRNLIPEGMNVQALSALFPDQRVSAKSIFNEAIEGDLDALILVGSDPMGDGLFPIEAEEAFAKVPVIQVAAIENQSTPFTNLMLPAAAYSEVRGTFINMEGRVRLADKPLKSIGDERPLWKVMMRLVQSMGHDVPAVAFEEIRAYVTTYLPKLKQVWDQSLANELLLPTPRNVKAEYLPKGKTKDRKGLDVVSRYSMYREGHWARASDNLKEAGEIHALADVLVHPDTLTDASLQEGMLAINHSKGLETFHVGVRDDVSPGVLFIARRGVAGKLSSVLNVELGAGTS